MTGNISGSISGRIHSFEKFGTMDGPGIRFVVFMQGCPLKCLYCHNRDMWEASGGIITTVDGVMDQLRPYLAFMRNSGGGITVTGGEPLMQAEFVAELFRRCQEIGIHTALDTSGHMPSEQISIVLQYTDLILFSIKHTTSEGYKRITGADQSLHKAFAKMLKESGLPVWARYVLVPGLTDAHDDLEAAARMIAGLGRVEKVEILPYHSMGVAKWEALGLHYPLEGTPAPDAEAVEAAGRILRSFL